MIKVQNLTYTYPNNKECTIDNLSFQVDKGQIYGFLGPSGSGKSTTQKVLYKHLANFQGEVTIVNKPLSAWDENFYNHIGVGFELPNHYEKLTAKENLEFFGGFYQKQYLPIPKLLGLVGLEKEANTLVSDFSKGMKMRLNFIRAFQHDPAVIFLDEPSSGLDPGNAKIIKELILKLKSEGKTIFLTTHNMFDADRLCDRVGFLLDGQLVKEGTPKELKKSYGNSTVRIEYFDNNSEQEALVIEQNQLYDHQPFQNILKENKLISIHSQEATLEEAFLKITGKPLTHER